MLTHAKTGKYHLGTSLLDPTSHGFGNTHCVQPWNQHVASLCLCGLPCLKYADKPEANPKGPSTQSVRTLVPKTIKSLVFETRTLKYWVLGPSGQGRCRTSTQTFTAKALVLGGFPEVYAWSQKKLHKYWVAVKKFK